MLDTSFWTTFATRDGGRIKKITGPVGVTTMKALMPEIVKKVIGL